MRATMFPLRYVLGISLILVFIFAGCEGLLGPEEDPDDDVDDVDDVLEVDEVESVELERSATTGDFGELDEDTRLVEDLVDFMEVMQALDESDDNGSTESISAALRMDSQDGDDEFEEWFDEFDETETETETGYEYSLVAEGDDTVDLTAPEESNLDSGKVEFFVSADVDFETQVQGELQEPGDTQEISGSASAELEGSVEVKEPIEDTDGDVHLDGFVGAATNFNGAMSFIQEFDEDRGPVFVSADVAYDISNEWSMALTLEVPDPEGDEGDLVGGNFILTASYEEGLVVSADSQEELQEEIESELDNGEFEIVFEIYDADGNLEHSDEIETEDLDALFEGETASQALSAQMTESMAQTD